MSIRKWIRNWLTQDAPVAPKLATVEQEFGDPSNMMRINVTKAMNGHIIQILTYKHNPHGPDWKGDVMVVPNGEDVIEVLKAGLVSRMLSR